MDIIMNGLSGWDTIKVIRKNKEWNSVKIYILSKLYKSTETIKMMKKFNIEGYSMKPCGKEHLLDQVELVLK